MKKILFTVLCAVTLTLVLPSAGGAERFGKLNDRTVINSHKKLEIGDDCTYNGIKLWGNVQVVTAFPDLKVQIVDAFPDIRVQWVDAFPDACGRWKQVDAFPDFKIQFVDAFPDIKIKEVDAFPGKP